MLRGHAPATVDEKGRLKLPSIFRSILEPKYGKDYFVTSIRGDAVHVYPMEVYAAFEDRLIRASAVAPLVNRLRSALNYYGQTATMDGQGRLLIHPLLREKVKIQGEVAVLGQQDHLDVWSRSAVESRVLDDPLTDADLQSLAGLGF
jgi:MraZ protein